MNNEATSLASRLHTNTEFYKTLNTIETLVSAIQAITTVGPQQIALVTLSLQFALEDERQPQRRPLIAHSTQYYLEELRRVIRKTDAVYLLNSTIHFVLPGANREGGKIVESRLWEALLWSVHNADEGQALRPRLMAIGHAAYSLTIDNDIHACISTASEACYSFDTHSEPETDSLETPQDNVSAFASQPSEEMSQEEDLTALARKLGVPYLSLLPRKKPEQVQRLVTLKLAHELQCYPIGRERGMLTVAFSQPQDTSTIARLHKETGLRIFPVLTAPHELQTRAQSTRLICVTPSAIMTCEDTITERNYFNHENTRYWWSWLHRLTYRRSIGGSKS